MRLPLLIGAAGLAVLTTPPVQAVSNVEAASGARSAAVRFPPYLQCVPFARQETGISIYGDAHTWWGQAAGRYARGFKPRVGAVMNFRPSGNSHLGHVAAVTLIIDSRTVLISHSNWSPINGRRGQIERNVRAVDVSENNDWSRVRVWFAPTQALGTTHWPLYGFIYPEKPKAGERTLTRPVTGPDVFGEDDIIRDIIRSARKKPGR